MQVLSSGRGLYTILPMALEISQLFSSGHEQKMGQQAETIIIITLALIFGGSALEILLTVKQQILSVQTCHKLAEY